MEGAGTTVLILSSCHCKQSSYGLTATVLRPLPVIFVACLLSQVLIFLSLFFFLFTYTINTLSTVDVFAFILGTSSTIQSALSGGGE